jgi:hypothetical protein
MNKYIKFFYLYIESEDGNLIEELVEAKEKAEVLVRLIDYKYRNVQVRSYWVEEGDIFYLNSSKRELLVLSKRRFEELQPKVGDPAPSTSKYVKENYFVNSIVYDGWITEEYFVEILHNDFKK